MNDEIRKDAEDHVWAKDEPHMTTTEKKLYAVKHQSIGFLVGVTAMGLAIVAGLAWGSSQS